MVIDTTPQDPCVGWRMVINYILLNHSSNEICNLKISYFNSSKADVLVEKKVKDIKKCVKEDSKENFDLSDIEKNSQDGFLLSAIASMPETPSFETDLCNVAFNADASAIQDATLSLPIKQEIKQEIITTEDTVRAATEKEVEISSCVVCDKKFKSKSCMNKHLRSVHAGLYAIRLSFNRVNHNTKRLMFGYTLISEIK